MHDIMIDLETLSTRADAAILSIGACLFDLATGEIGKTFHRHIHFSDYPLNGHVSAETVKWWLKQDEEARQSLIDQKTAVSLPAAMTELRDFVPKSKQATFWSNGATFDLIIIRNALDRLNYLEPWSYWQERDVRTIVDVAFRITGRNAAKETEFQGVKHNALADAIHQVKYVSAAYQLIKQGVAA